MIHLLVLEINNKQIAMKTLKFPDAAGSRRSIMKKNTAGRRRSSMKKSIKHEKRKSNVARTPMPTLMPTPLGTADLHIKEISIHK
jgi:hypothetical protein